MTLVPKNEPLLAEVMIENKDVGFVVVNQPVRLKLAAFQFQKYGFLEGNVKTIGADSTTPRELAESGSANSEQEPAFNALVELDSQRLALHPDLPLAAGMQVSAEIVQGQRTVLEYLLSPLQRVASEAAMER